MLQDLVRLFRRARAGNLEAREVYAGRRWGPRSDGLAVPGAGFACPICGGQFRRFLPFGLNGRRNARCPGCGSLERHRFLWLHLRDKHRILRRRLSMLHIAPEPCIRAALSANPALDYLSADLFDPDADEAVDITALPFRDNSFDFIICSHVLEHVQDDCGAMAELHRVLAPGGCAVVMVPIDLQRTATYEDSSVDTAAGRESAFGHPYHVRICGADYPDRLRRAGFDVAPAYSTALSPHMRRFWRISKTVLFDCRKPRSPATRRKSNGPAC